MAVGLVATDAETEFFANDPLGDGIDKFVDADAFAGGYRKGLGI